MAFELERILYKTEDFLRRSLPSRSAREAQKRRAQRKLHEAMRRLRRSGYLFVGILAALLAYSILVAPIGLLTWLVAIPTALLFALLSLFWPSRKAAARPEKRQVPPLDELAARVEDGLIDRRGELPGRALPKVDAISDRLSELQPHLVALGDDSMLGGEARRLIGEHLPRLVDSYLDLPPSARTSHSEASRRFTESLAIVSGELDDLLDRCCRDRELGFETQRRFIESRYKDGNLLPPE